MPETWNDEDIAEPEPPKERQPGDLLGAGSDLGRYLVDGLIGRGGMAVVYRVQHKELGGHFALKLLTVIGTTMRARLRREGRAQSGLQHPNVVSVVDIIEVEGIPGLVMEYIAGPALDQVIGAELTFAQRDALAIDILRGVGAAHESGVVHRDLKPANILLAPAAGNVHAKVADFGLAKSLVDDPSDSLKTRTGSTMGTPAYMAPEQIHDASRVDERTDVFALGAVLYELVTARRCFGFGSMTELFQRIESGDYVPPADLEPTLPSRVTSTIERALQTDPARRFATVAAMLEAWSEGDPEGIRRAGTWDASQIAQLRQIHRVRPLAPQASQPQDTYAGLTTEQSAPPPEPIAPPTQGIPSWVPGLVGALVISAALGAYTFTQSGSQPLILAARGLAPTSGEQRFPDISPDGKRVAYTDKEDIWVIRVGGASPQPRNLTLSVDGRATQPAFSPNGEELAFVVDGEIWVMGADGERPARVGRGYWPDWSPDGKHLVFSVADKGDVWSGGTGIGIGTIDLSTRRRVVLTEDGCYPTWSLDGSELAYFRYNGLHVIPSAGGEPRRISPSGFWMPTWRERGIYAIRVRGEAHSLVRFPHGSDETTQPEMVAALPTFPWDYDIDRAGRLVVVDEVRGEFVTSRVQDDGSLDVITDPALLLTSPSQGPGNNMVFASYLSGEALYFRDGEGFRKGQQGAYVRGPSWSPVDDTIVFNGAIETGKPGIFSVRADGSDLRRISPVSWNRSSWAHWSPDGSQLSVTWGQPVVLDPSGSWEDQLDAWKSPALAGWEAGEFSPDGTRLMVSDDDNHLRILDIESQALSSMEVAGYDGAWLDNESWVVGLGSDLTHIDVTTGESRPIADLWPAEITNQPSLAVERDGSILVSTKLWSGTTIVGTVSEEDEPL